MRIFRRRHEDLDARVDSARVSAQEAQAEADLSQARHEVARDIIIGPMLRAAEHNQFAAMLRADLEEGYGRRS